MSELMQQLKVIPKRSQSKAPLVKGQLKTQRRHEWFPERSPQFVPHNYKLVITGRVRSNTVPWTRVDQDTAFIQQST